MWLIQGVVDVLYHAQFDQFAVPVLPYPFTVLICRAGSCVHGMNLDARFKSPEAERLN